MTVDIWSDVACPFCYIGKRKFELALEKFTGKEQVNIVWRSFQLDPEAKPVPGKTQAEVLAQKKGWSLEQTRNIMAQVSATAAEVGLHYNMDSVVTANTFNAHRLTHLGNKHGRQNEVEEGLFKAYFIEGKDVGSVAVLTQIGLEAGIPEAELTALFLGNEFAGAVQIDQLEAQHVGVRGVPFFVFNKKYAVSGAQSPEVFLQVLDRVWEEEKVVPIVEGATCGPDGICN